MTETTLIFQLKNGDGKAVRRWYAGYAQKLLLFILKSVSNRRDAEELCQDTFVSCLESLPVFRGTSSLFTWMCSIARHEIADYYRKKYAKKVLSVIPFADAFLPNRLHDMHDVSHEVRVALARLSQYERELLLLKYVDGKSVKAIARAFGQSMKSVESALYRARKAFQEEYAEE